MSRFGRLEFVNNDTQTNTDVRQQNLQHQVKLTEEERDWLKVAAHDRRSGMYESALRHYSRALELDKSLVGGWVGQVQMLIAMEEYPEAELWSRKALELFRNNADLLAGRAQALCRIGDLRSAQASCDAAIGQPGLNAYPWIARGDLMIARREPLDDFCFEKAIQIDSDWLVPLEIAGIYMHYDRPTKALPKIRTAIEQAPDQAWCWYQKGTCELELGLTQAARQSFARCLDLVPKHAEASLALRTLDNNRRPIRQLFRRLFKRS